MWSICPRFTGRCARWSRKRPGWSRYGERQIGIAWNLDDSALQRDLGPMPLTPLAEGIRQTLQHFRQLRSEGRLETYDLP